MQLKPDEWKKLFELRDDLGDGDRALVRRAIKYLEYLEQKVSALKYRLNQSEKDNRR